MRLFIISIHLQAAVTWSSQMTIWRFPCVEISVTTCGGVSRHEPYTSEVPITRPWTSQRSISEKHRPPSHARAITRGVTCGQGRSRRSRPLPPAPRTAMIFPRSPARKDEYATTAVVRRPPRGCARTDGSEGPVSPHGGRLADAWLSGGRRLRRSRAASHCTLEGLSSDRVDKPSCRESANDHGRHRNLLSIAEHWL